MVIPLQRLLRKVSWHFSRNFCIIHGIIQRSRSLFLRPDLIDFDKLKKSNAHYNLQNAFNLAEQHLGLTKLLDPEGASQQAVTTTHHFHWRSKSQHHLTMSGIQTTAARGAMRVRAYPAFRISVLRDQPAL